MSAKNLSGNEIRAKFLEFFEKKHGHKLYESSSLIPDNPTILLNTAGMVQFVPIFLGYEKAPEPPRATSVQKCARAGGKDSDIENVGRTPRHHTFFEMLGNFSFGDYFKEEIIPWSWDFITNELGLEVDKLWVTVYETDEEALKIWRDKVGVAPERILKKGKKDNFWGPPGPTGPCGPCTEIHYDLGKEYSCGIENCGIDTCECDRYVEIWNLVFMELFQDEEGKHTPLEKKNVDTGMGLERITMVCQGKSSTFDTDLIKPILDKVCELSGKKYSENDKTDVSLRIITDHVRCVSFMIADGLVPGNEGRNYVLRMIARRALRHGKILGLELPFLYKIVDAVVDNYSHVYPELKENRDKIVKVIKTEEELFAKTLEKGQGILDELLAKGDISGEDAFKLYDTYGYPLELTIEIAEEKGIKVDKKGFEEAMAEQKKRSKEAHTKVKLTDDMVYVELAENLGATEFIGYEETSGNAEVLEVIGEGEILEVILDKTPFYAESGGQVGDTGILKNDSFEGEVLDTTKINGMFIHKVEVKNGSLEKGDRIEAIVDESRRKKIVAHHTVAHLLQSALIKVLGDGVAQKGSQVEEARTRFDFSFERAMTKEEVEKAEALINSWIVDNVDCSTKVMSIDEAKSAGAIALFGEKYEDDVRVVSVGGVSKELCGGTHVDSTSEIRLVKIVSESAIAAGTRRIEAVCSDAAFDYMNTKNEQLDELSEMLKAPAGELSSRIEKLMADNREQQKKLKEFEAKIALAKVDDLINQSKDIDGGKFLCARLDDVAPDGLKKAVEKLSSKLGAGIVAMASVFDGKIMIMVSVSDDFVKKGFKAGELVNQIAQECDGRGGGRPNFAQAGAKAVDKLDDALCKFKKKF